MPIVKTEDNAFYGFPVWTNRDVLSLGNHGHGQLKAIIFRPSSPTGSFRRTIARPNHARGCYGYLILNAFVR